ncbi:hypothetical protein RchiOBHm_Chr4g0411611 [Rosa chinensis]|uniref:Uncharacterized protein n=1 Tax=Rosa chinensis TaxID=74649 RepID=A0A2P6QVQ0_ROSCH|nr:hypothetical protein RchiOBHm_Chr4g0411611 [Rosa chinensis]
MSFLITNITSAFFMLRVFSHLLFLSYILFLFILVVDYNQFSNFL